MIYRRLSQADTWLLELFLGLYTLVWGLNFANPLTDVFANSPRTYALLSGFPDAETLLGLVGIFCGTLTLGVVLRGARTGRMLVIGAVGVVWLLYAIAVSVPTRGAAGGVTFLTAIAHWYCWARQSYRGRRGWP